MATRTVLNQKIQSGETPDLTFTMVDVDGNAIDIPTDVTAMTLDYYNVADDMAINSRLAQDVRGAGSGTNNHTLDAAGLVTWKLVAADTQGFTADQTVVARYTWTYNDAAAVARTGIHEIQFTIEGLQTIT